MLREIVEGYIKPKDFIKKLDKDGSVEVIIGATDTWAMIDWVDDGVAHGIDQFDNDVEIVLAKDKIRLA